MLKPEDIKVKVTLTEGYAERCTAACLEVLEQRKRKEELARSFPGNGLPKRETA